MSIFGVRWLAFISLTGALVPSRGYFVEEPADVTPIPGQNVVLPCRVLGLLPTMTVSWTKDSSFVSENYDVKAEVHQKFNVQGDRTIGQYNLVVANVSFGDEGVYQCHIINTNGVFFASSRPGTLDIAVLPSGGPFCSIEPAVDPLHSSIRDGDQYVIKCQLETGNPPVGLEWRDSNDNIPESVVQRGDRLTHITSAWVAKRHDRHMTFTCLATHAALPFPLLCSLGPFNVEYPPVIFISAAEERVEIGAVASFSCAADANPPVMEYAWTFNGVYVPAPGAHDLYDRFKVRGGPNGNSVLTVENVSFEDNGAEVKCLVRNPHGTDEKTLALLVSAPITVRTDVSTINNGPSTLAIFTCDSTSALASRHTWYYNEEVVPSDTEKFTLLKDDSVLVVRQVTEADNLVVVTCEASNGLATENSTSILRLDPQVVSNTRRDGESPALGDAVVGISFVAGLSAGVLAVLLIEYILWKRGLALPFFVKTTDKKAKTYTGADTRLQVETNNLNQGVNEHHMNLTYGDTDSMGYIQPISDAQFEAHNAATARVQSPTRPYADINMGTLEPEHDYQKLNANKNNGRDAGAVAKRVEEFEYCLARK